MGPTIGDCAKKHRLCPDAFAGPAFPGYALEAPMHQESPIMPVLVESAPCQEVVMTGPEIQAKGLAALPVPISTPGFDSAPYLTATLCVTKDPDNKIQNMGTYRAALKANDRLGVRMASRLGGAGGYLHWEK